MSVVFTRTGTPLPGKQAAAFEFLKNRVAYVNEAYGLKAELHVRFGGPLGQVVMVSHHANLQELEDIKRRVIADSTAGKMPAYNDALFSNVEDAVWLTK